MMIQGKRLNRSNIFCSYSPFLQHKLYAVRHGNYHWLICVGDKDESLVDSFEFLMINNCNSMPFWCAVGRTMRLLYSG